MVDQKCVIALFCFTTLLDVMGQHALFGYLPELIQKFGVHVTRVGYTQGWMTAELYIANCLALLTFTYFASSVNRLRLFTALCAFQVLCFLLIAFSTSTSWFAASLFLLSASIIRNPILEKVVFHISDDTTQAKILNFAKTAPFNAGLLLGPAVGGVLSFPTEQYPNIFPSSLTFLNHYLIFLPNALFAILMLLLTIQSCFVLSELHIEDKHDNYQSRFFQVMKLLLSDDDVKVAAIATVFHSITAQGYVSLFSLWLQTPINIGGVGYSPAQAGFAMLLSGICVFFLDLTVVPKLVQWLGVKCGLQFWTLVMIFVTALQPLLSNGRLDGNVQGFFIVISMAIIRAANTGYTILVMSTFYNVVPVQYIGETMNIRNLVRNASHAAGHLIISSCFAWSLTNEVSYTESALGFPMNHVFAFYILSIILIIMVIVHTRFSERVEKRHYNYETL